MYRFIEEISLNTWPAEQSVLLAGWILRSAAGYTKRSNSVNPLYGPPEQEASLVTGQKIQLAERYYEEAGLRPVFKITPFTQPSGLDDLLTRRGYVKDSPSAVRLLEFKGQRLPERQTQHLLQIREQLTADWLEAFSRLSQLSAGQQDALCRMLASSGLQQGFALLLKNGVPAACGLGVIQHGYIALYDIVTAPAFRRQGLAYELIQELLRWGQAQGAEASFLQVVQANAGAYALYDKLGYREIYQYWYRVKE